MSKLPSQKLRSLAAKHNANDFKQILEKNLYPFLDRLPAAQLESLLDILNTEGTLNKGVWLVEFDKRSVSILDRLRALRKSIQRNRREGWEEQGEMMGNITGELNSWMPILWKVGVEMGVEHALVHKSLRFCKTAHDELSSTDSLVEFSDIDNPEITIEDASGRIVYKTDCSPTAHVIFWVWCELLLSSIAQGPNDDMAKAFVADIKNLKLTKEILERLDDTTSCSRTLPSQYGTKECEERDWKLEEKRDLLLNAHWTPEMRAAVPKAKALLV